MHLFLVNSKLSEEIRERMNENSIITPQKTGKQAGRDKEDAL